jgi:hypothetical protein
MLITSATVLKKIPKADIWKAHTIKYLYFSENDPILA